MEALRSLGQQEEDFREAVMQHRLRQPQRVVTVGLQWISTSSTIEPSLRLLARLKIVADPLDLRWFAVHFVVMALARWVCSPATGVEADPRPDQHSS